MLEVFGLDMVLIGFLISIDFENPDLIFFSLDLHRENGNHSFLLLHGLASSIEQDFLIFFPIFWNYLNFCYPNQVNLFISTQIHSFFLRKEISKRKNQYKTQ